MYTANITNKVVEANGVLALTVVFTDGETSIVEIVKPQDEDGFDHWIESRLTSLETSDKLKNEDNINKPVTLESLKEVDTQSSAEKIWFEKLNRLHRVNTYASVIVPVVAAEIEILTRDILNTYLPEYFNKI